MKKACAAILLILVALAMLAAPVSASAARGAPRNPRGTLAPFAADGGGVEVGHLFGYLALAFVVLEIVLGLSLRLTSVQKKHRIGVRWVHLVVGTLILVFVIIHVLTIGG
jgi:hypothetical protein